MNIQDERELRDQLAGLLDGVEPRPAPVTAALRGGRRLRHRRWATAAGAVAVAVAAAGIIPAALQSQPHEVAPAAAHYSVTVRSLGAAARGGVISAGVTDGKTWRIVASGPARSPDVQSRGQITGPVITEPADVLGLYRDTAADPVTFADGGAGAQGQADHNYNTLYGVVSPAVTRVVLELPGGRQVALKPVSWQSHRWIGVVLPDGVLIARATAYAGSRELAYSVPFRGLSFARWWKPGQAGPAALTRTIGSGIAGGRAWRDEAMIGPWGWCYTLGSGANSDCLGTAPSVPAGQLVNVPICSPSSAGQPATGIAVTAPAVTRVVLRFGNGTSAAFPAVQVGASRVLGYAVPEGLKVTGSAEYGSRGQVLSAGAGGSPSARAWSCTQS